MKKLTFIGIEYALITGVKNPLFSIQGTVLEGKYTFTILVDGEEVKKEKVEYTAPSNFFYSIPLKVTQKEVEVFVTYKNKKYTIARNKNSLSRRVYGKGKNIVYYSGAKAKTFGRVLVKGTKFLWKEHHFLVPPTLIPKYVRAFKKRMRVGDIFYNPFNTEEYNKWLEANEVILPYTDLPYKPLISILIPTYNISRNLLSACLDSVLEQTYPKFEICIADDASTLEETIETLKEYEEKYSNIHVTYRKKNGHISEATNSALDLAKGTFVALMDNDDVIRKDALYQMVQVLNKDKKIDMIYSDEDKLDLKGRRCDPNFKSDFAPDSLLSSNYICHFTLLRTKIMKEIGGFRKGFEGAQDYDLFLRFTEKTKKIHHIPEILYHWRMIPGSTSMTIGNKSYAVERSVKALDEALERRNIKGKAHVHPLIPYYMIEYKYTREPMISILIPTRDFAETLEECLVSIYEKTTYKNYEILVLNNNSSKKETFELFEKYKKEHKNFKVIDVNTEFNYSYINNVGVKKAKGEYILLLNNDTKVITSSWLETMVGYAMQDHVGAVGTKLLYPDDTVQHGGVILGLGGIATHAFLSAERRDPGMYGRLFVPYNYGAVTAACLMISKKKFNEVGGLEEELKVAYNDIDLNIKLLEKGYYNVLVPQVELYHFESKSRGLDTTSEKYKRFLWESDYLKNKWKNYLERDPFYNPHFSLMSCYRLDKIHKEEKQNEKTME